VTNKADLEAFIRQLGGLNIEITRNEEGHLTVCSSSEPLFCYDVEHEDEIGPLVVDTLQSYARHFFQIENLPVGTKSQAIETPLPVERSTPVSRITPIFDLAA